MSEPTDPAAPALARAEALFADLSLATVADWKTAHPGRPAIGHLLVYKTPRELIDACGALPVGITGGGDQIDFRQRRRLLPELHLPFAALHRRAGVGRPARPTRRHGVPLHVRRDPEPVGDLAALASIQAVLLPRPAAVVRGRRRPLLPSATRGASPTGSFSAVGCRSRRSGWRRACGATTRTGRPSCASTSCAAMRRGRCRPTSALWW